MPTLKDGQSLASASWMTKAGAAIMETPRSALEQIATPSATKMIPNSHSRRESNSYGFERQISASAADKFLAISYIASKFLFASAKYLLTQNCAAPSGGAIFDRFWWDFASQSTPKDAKIARRRAYEFGSLRLCSARYDINPSFAQQTYRTRSVYRIA